MTETEPELKIVDERTAFHVYGTIKVRHYNDGTWELLDKLDRPILSGKCGQTVEQDVAEISRK